MRPFRHAITFGFGITLAVASAAVGQAIPVPPSASPPAQRATAPTPPPSQTTTLPPASRDIDFIAEPFRIDALGLSVNLPISSEVNRSESAGQTRATIRDAAKEGACRWLINLETLRVDDRAFTLEKAADRSLARLMGLQAAPEVDPKNTPPAASAPSRPTLLSRIRSLRVPGVSTPGERFYVALPGSQADRIVHGVTIFEAAPGQFVAFELICGQDLLVDSQRVYESMIATVRIEDPAVAEARRRELVTTGTAFLARLSPADYAKAIDQPPQLFRIYAPAPGGAASDAVERGYRSVRFFKGTRSQIDPQATALAPGVGNPAGFLAEIGARLIEPGPGGPAEFQVLDVNALYFLSEDRQEEAWSIRTAVRIAANKAPAVFVEMGTRSGRTMVVSLKNPRKGDTLLNPTVPADGYINQLEGFLLPRLLVQAGIEAELGFYGYQPLTESITLRRERIEHDPAMPGVWKITSRPRESATPATYLYRASGELIRGDLADGLIMEPIWPADLERLWSSKGLPTGSLTAAPGGKSR